MIAPLVAALALAQDPSLAGSRWRAWLETPGGELPFELELARAEDGTWDAFLLNDPERIPVSDVTWDGEELALALPYYDSRITARREDERLTGLWEKRRGPHEVAHVPFHAEPAGRPRFPASKVAPPAAVAGRWAVDLESDEQAAVAIFEQAHGERELRGTFLTATGDYRYLAGSVDGAELALSCFDGAHAFLFHATLQPDRTLSGDFWSGNWHHERWTARADKNAALADPFEQSDWDARTSLADLVFPDLEGQPRSLADPALAGRATLLVVFGSWCPNCNDEARLLVELDAKYRARGLAILGLAFELSGEFEHDAAQVKLFAERHGVSFPLFLAGLADKDAATQALGALDRVRAFPTTIFVGVDGRVRAVHSGYAGPATGEEHVKLRQDFEARIEALLSATPPSDAEIWDWFSAATWFSDQEFAGASYSFRLDESGGREVLQRLLGSGEPVIGEETLPVRIAGDSVWIGERGWRLDREAGVLLDPRDCGARLHPRGSATPLLVLQGYREDEAGILKALADRDPLVRREAIVALARRREPSTDAGLPEVLPLLGETNLELRLAATWAVGRCCEGRARELLSKQLAHPNAALRRESVRALGRLAGRWPEVRAQLEPLRRDPDPLVRAAVEQALAR